MNLAVDADAALMRWTLSSGRTSLLVIAFVPAMFFYFQAVKLFWRLLGEIQAGTIEQVYLSPLPTWLVAAAGRLVAAIAETLLVMGVVYGIVSAFVTLRFHWTAAALVPAAFLLLTGIGGLAWVAVTAAGYLAVGIGAFRLGEKITKTRGTLGSY